jgi:hypothetical protein
MEQLQEVKKDLMYIFHLKPIMALHHSKDLNKSSLTSVIKNKIKIIAFKETFKII